MSASKTVVYYNIESSGDFVFLLPKEHISSQEISMLSLERGLRGYAFEKNYRFTVRNFHVNVDEVFAFVARLLEHGFVPEGHSGPERGATHFGRCRTMLRPALPSALVAKVAR